MSARIGVNEMCAYEVEHAQAGAAYLHRTPLLWGCEPPPHAAKAASARQSGAIVKVRGAVVGANRQIQDERCQRSLLQRHAAQVKERQRSYTTHVCGVCWE